MPKTQEAQLRHATYYLGVVKAADSLYKQGDQAFELALGDFRIDETNIRTGLESAAKYSKDSDQAAAICNDFPNAGALLFAMLFAPVERFQWLEYAREAARGLGDKQAEGWHIGNTGLVHLHVGNVATAIECFEQASDICRKFHDRAGEARSFGNLGLAYKELGEIRRAIENYEIALTITEEIDDRHYMGGILGNLGSAYSLLGEYARAIEYYRRDYDIAQELGNLRGQAGVFSNISLVYCATRDYPRAVRFVERSLCISRRIGDRVAEMGAISSIGLIHLNAGAPEKAVDSFDEMLAIALEIQELRGEAYATFNKSLALADLGDLKGAATCAESSLSIFEQLEDSHLVGVKEHLSQLRQRILNRLSTNTDSRRAEGRSRELTNAYPELAR